MSLTFQLDLCISQYEDRVKSASEYFLPREKEWQTALQNAVNEEKMRLASISITSERNGYLLDPTLAADFTNAQFRHVKDLGEGTYGKVTEVMEQSTKALYAQKLIRVRDRHPRTRDLMEARVKSEVNIMQKLRHHHIAAVYFYVKDTAAFRLIMHPVAEYDLRVFLETVCVDGGYLRRELQHLDSWFGCLTGALAFAHDQSVKHEDIKPHNILIKDHKPFLSDFGSAKDFSALEAGSISSDQLVAGTPVYTAPENTGRGRRADVFSLGCVFSEMLTVRQERSLQDYRNARSVEGKDFPFAYRRNLAAVNDWLHALPGMDESGEVQGLLLEVIQHMLEADPEDRYTAKQVKKRFRAEDCLFCSTCS